MAEMNLRNLTAVKVFLLHTLILISFFFSLGLFAFCYIFLLTVASSNRFTTKWTNQDSLTLTYQGLKLAARLLLNRSNTFALV